MYFTNHFSLLSEHVSLIFYSALPYCFFSTSVPPPLPLSPHLPATRTFPGHYFFFSACRLPWPPFSWVSSYVPFPRSLHSERKGGQSLEKENAHKENLLVNLHSLCRADAGNYMYAHSPCRADAGNYLYARSPCRAAEATTCMLISPRRHIAHNYNFILLFYVIPSEKYHFLARNRVTNSSARVQDLENKKCCNLFLRGYFTTINSTQEQQQQKLITKKQKLSITEKI